MGAPLTSRHAAEMRGAPIKKREAEMATERSLMIPGAETESTAIPLIPPMVEWQTILGLAGALVKSGFLPPTIKNAEAAAAIILKGREIGIPPMHAFAHVAVIQGRPTCSAELQLALLARGGVAWTVHKQGDDGEAVIEFRRPGFGPFVSRWTMEDAKRAGLVGKDNWKNYPAAMLRARAISAGARVIGPDLLAGMGYTHEELGATVTEDGDIKRLPMPEPAPAPAQSSGQNEAGSGNGSEGAGYVSDDYKQFILQMREFEKVLGVKPYKAVLKEFGFESRTAVPQDDPVTMLKIVQAMNAAANKA